MRDIREEAKPYLDGPFFKRVPEDSTFDGNGILYTGIYLNTIRKYDTPTVADWALVHTLYNRSTVEPGLIDRGHDNLTVEKQDDYIGLCRAMQIVGHTNGLLEIYNYGHKYWWFIKNVKGKVAIGEWLSCLFWRLPGVVQHIKICADKKLNLFDKFWWFLSIASVVLKAKAGYGGRNLEHLMVNAYKDSEKKYWLCNLATKVWDNTINARYKNKMGDCYQGFFQLDPELKQQPTHLFASWWQGQL